MQTSDFRPLGAPPWVQGRKSLEKNKPGRRNKFGK
jgi:hypothetical protein